MLNDYALLGIATVDSNYGLYNDDYLNFEEDNKWFNTVTNACIVVTTEDYFKDKLKSIPLLDRFNVVICDLYTDHNTLLELNSRYSGLSVYFTTSLNPNTWISAAEYYVNYVNSKEEIEPLDLSRIYLIGGSSLYNVFWNEIHIFYLTQVFALCSCEEKLPSLSTWIPIYNISDGIISEQKKVPYSIDLLVKRS